MYHQNKMKKQNSLKNSIYIDKYEQKQIINKNKLITIIIYLMIEDYK